MGTLLSFVIVPIGVTGAGYMIHGVLGFCTMKDIPGEKRHFARKKPAAVIRNTIADAICSQPSWCKALRFSASIGDLHSVRSFEWVPLPAPSICFALRFFFRPAKFRFPYNDIISIELCKRGLILTQGIEMYQKQLIFSLSSLNLKFWLWRP